MESAVDRIELESDQPVAPCAAVARALEESLDGQRATSGPREFDDIPSVVRAILTGYDEV